MVVWRIFRWELIGLVIRGKRIFWWNRDGKAARRIRIVRSGQPRLFLRVSQAADYKLQKEKAICVKCSTNCLSPAGQPPRYSTVPIELLSTLFIISHSLSFSHSFFLYGLLSLPLLWNIQIMRLWRSPLLNSSFFTYFLLMSNCAVSNLIVRCTQSTINVLWVWKTKIHTCNELHTKLRFLIRLFIMVFFNVLERALAQLFQELRYKPWSRGFYF